MSESVGNKGVKMSRIRSLLLAADENDLWFFDMLGAHWISAKGKILSVPAGEYQTQTALIRAAEDVALFNNLAVYEVGRDANLHDVLIEISKQFRSH